MAVLNPHPRYFPTAVESILGQSFEDFEFVIVEDPSETSAKELLGGISDQRLRLFTNPRRTSLRDQRNQAIGHSHSSLLAILDADDVAEPGRLQAQVDAMRSRPEIAVLGTDLLLVDADDRLLGLRRYPRGHAGIVSAMKRYNPVAQPSVMLRRDAVLAVGGYQWDRPVEDYELWCRLALSGYEFATYPKPLTRHRLHAQSSKSSIPHDTLRASIELKRRYWGSRLGWRGHLRIRLEEMLLRVPARTLIWAFRMWELSRRF